MHQKLSMFVTPSTQTQSLGLSIVWSKNEPHSASSVFQGSLNDHLKQHPADAKWSEPLNTQGTTVLHVK